MRALVRSELLKQRTTRTTPGLFGAMLGLVVLAVVLHGLLPEERLASEATQLMILGRGGFLAALVAGLLGAMSVTAEIRHGTIRPTLIVTPRRARVVAAKAWVSALFGAASGLLAGGLAVVVGSAVLGARRVEIVLDRGDLVMLVLGSAAAASLWAVMGTGVGGAVRNQVPALVGICAWLLFIEGLLVDDLVGLGTIGRYLPGMAAAAVSGQDPDTMLAPGVGLVLLAGYAIAAVSIGAIFMSRHDVE